MRKPLKITSRSSTITNAFVQTIMPFEPPSDEEKSEARRFLGQSDDDQPTCAYCGDRASDWDHIRPLVKAKRPTGYLSDIGNMLPACGSCNQSKSGQDWKAWMTGSARNSPASRNVSDLDERIARIEAYVKKFGRSPIDIKAAVDPELWSAYWALLEAVHVQLTAAERLARHLRAELASVDKPDRSQ